MQAQCLPGGGRASTLSGLGNSAALRDGAEESLGGGAFPC